MVQFLGMARGSALEVQTQLEIAMMLEFGERLELEHAARLAEEVARMLNSSIVTLRAATSSRP
jgi:four helix bundle protein